MEEYLDEPAAAVLRGCIGVRKDCPDYRIRAKLNALAEVAPAVAVHVLVAAAVARVLAGLGAALPAVG